MNLTLQTAQTATAPTRKRPTVEQWLLANPGWHTVATICNASGYSYSHTKNVCEWLTVNRKAIRDGAPHTRTPKYCAIVDYFGGFRLA
jgi:hypothetical protein